MRQHLARLGERYPLAPDAPPVATSQLANAVRCHDETGLDSRLPLCSRLAAFLTPGQQPPLPRPALRRSSHVMDGQSARPARLYIAVDATTRRS